MSDEQAPEGGGLPSALPAETTETENNEQAETADIVDSIISGDAAAAPDDESATPDGDEAPEVAYTLNGKEYTKDQVDAALTERESYSKKNRAFAGENKRYKETATELAKARRANEMMLANITQVLNGYKSNLSQLDPNDPRLADVPGPQLAAQMRQAAIRDRQIDDMIAKFSQFGNAPPPLEMNREQAIAGFNKGHQMAMGMALTDDTMGDMYERKVYQRFITDAVTVFKNYGLPESEITASLLLDPSEPYIKMAHDLVRFSKMNGTKTGATAVPKAGAATKSSANRTGAVVGGGAKGPPKNMAELRERSEYIDQLRKSGRNITNREGNAYINQGVTPEHGWR